MIKCKWCNRKIVEPKDNMKNFCDKFCYKRFNYYNNRELKIKQTRDWVINNKERVAKYKHELFIKNYIPKRAELNEELSSIIKRLRIKGRKVKAKEYSKSPESMQKKREYRRRPEVKKYMRLKWKEWAKKNNTQLRIRFRIANNLRKRINDLIEGKEIVKQNRGEISFSKIARYLFERLPNDFYEKDYHIDHIKPLCSFDLTIKEQFLEAFSPENHRWLLAEDNLKKGAKDKLLSIRRKNHE
jgi:hypothetical protein